MVLITSAKTLSIIYQVERTVNKRDIVYEDLDNFKVAVWCLVCLGSVGVIYHILTIPVHCLYTTVGINEHYKIYVLMVSTVATLLKFECCCSTP